MSFTQQLDTDDLQGADLALYTQIQALIKQITFDYQRQQLNTVVSAAMKWLNLITEARDNIKASTLAYAWSQLLIVLFPITPHLADYLWQQGCDQSLLATAQWPTYDEKALQGTQKTIVIQVNGKLKDRIEAPQGASQEALLKQLCADPKWQSFFDERKIIKVVHVQDRLINIVV